VRLLPSASIRGRLFGAIFFTSVAALVFSGAAFFFYDLVSYRQASSAALAAEAELVGHVTTAALQFDDRAAAKKNLSFLGTRPAVRVAAVYTPRGALFAVYERDEIARSELPALPKPDGIEIAGDRIEVFRRIVADKEIIGTVYVAQDLGLYRRIGTYALIVLGVIVAALSLSAYLSSRVQESIAGPIIQVSSLAREVVERRDYSVRAQRTTNDEIGALADAFNEMLAEIQRRTSALESKSEEVTRLAKDLERRVSERTLQLEESNLQLRGANTAKSSFLSMMSHEIRTPMNGVLGMLELLALSELDEHQRTTLDIVRDSGQSLLRIIDDILDFSKIEAGKLEIRPEAASVARVVSKVVGIYSGNASNKALVLKSQVDPRIGPALMFDPLRLQQILNNLVSNAIKFTSKGSVEIRAELVDRGDEEEIVRFTVKDSGIGIPPEARAKLFEPFAQADAEITRVFGGTGLGLSIGQRLAKMMGGSLEVASLVGKGTTVLLSLPLPIADARMIAETEGATDQAVATVAERREPPSREEAESEGTLVLVVDDHPVNRIVLMRQVNVLGYANEAAEDGREAFALWESGRFALVITDCNMPEMDGYELARAIRAHERERGSGRTPIIACTANALKGEADNCLAAGMDDYVAKPVDLRSLAAKLDRWLPLAGEPADAAGPSTAGSSEQPEAPIDLTVLGSIPNAGAELERQVLAEFFRLHRKDASQLERAIADRDAGSAAQLAHRTRSASHAIGAAALAQAAGRIETAARANDWDGAMAGADVFRRETARLEAHLVSIGLLAPA